jgi:hypothetical protein
VRTTIDIDSSVLEELRRRQRRENKTLGQLASELLAHALAMTADEPPAAPLKWAVGPMGARVDLEDRDAIQRILDAQS